MSDLRQKARDLIEMAADERGNYNERVSMAFKAIQIIRDNDLLAGTNPLDELLKSDNETVQAAVSIFDRLSDPDFIKSVKKVAGGIRRKGKR